MTRERRPGAEVDSGGKHGPILDTSDVKAGRDVLYAWAGGKSHKVKVVSPVFVDPEGARQNV